MPRRTDLAHPVATSALCGSYQCGHISRSDNLHVKRALFLYVRRTRGARFTTRNEDGRVLAALTLMMAGRTCADVRAAADPTYVAPVATPAPATPAPVRVSPECAEVLQMVALGHDIPEIAEATHRNVETVRSLMARARQITSTHTSTDAAAVLCEWGVIAG